MQKVELAELLGNKTMHNGRIVDPYIWKNNDEIYWNGFTPNMRDYNAMVQTVDDYLSCFSDQELSEDETLSIDLY